MLKSSPLTGLAGFLNTWWNLPFLVLLGLVGVFLALQVIGLAGFAAEGDHDADGSADAGGDHDTDTDGLTFSGALAFFGVGRVPLMVLLFALFIFTGFTGIILNSLGYLHYGGNYPAWLFAPVSLASLAVGLTAMRLSSRLLVRLFDIGARGATAKHELSGKLGVVASPTLGQTFGEIRVRDARGNELLVHARIEGGETPLRLGDEVVLVDYDPQTELFLASSLPKTWVDLARDGSKLRPAKRSVAPARPGPPHDPRS